MADLDPDNLHRLRVVDLKELLTQRGLPTAGLKANLVQRLREALVSVPQEEGAVHIGDVVPGEEIDSQETPEDEFVENEQVNLQAAEEERWRIEEERRLQAEEQWRHQQEEENQCLLEQERKAKEEQVWLEEENKKRFEEEQKSLEEERRRQFEVEEQRRQYEEEEQRRQYEEEEQQRRQYEEEQQRRQYEEEQQRRQYEEEQQRRQYEEDQRRQFEGEQRRQFEEEQRRQFEENQRRQYEENQRRQYEENQRRQFEENQRRQFEENKRRQFEEERRKQFEEEQKGQFKDDNRREFEDEEQPDNELASDVQTDLIKLPQAVEKLFALKSERAQQLGVDPDAVVQPDIEEKENASVTQVLTKALVSVDEDVEEETTRNVKDLKNKRKKKKKKRSTKRERQTEQNPAKQADQEPVVDIDIEYVQDVMDPSDPLYSQFIKIFEKFKLNEPEKEKLDAAIEAKEDLKQEPAKADKKKPVDLDDDDMDDEKGEEEEKPKLSKRKLKKLSRMSVAELKQKVNRPELVEMHDVTAKDPVLLLHLKASRNTVPVPRHWCFKRKYLQGKRGIEKPAFELPDFIKRTGIMEMRQALQEKEDQKTMKAKMRERVRPKLGKIDIDYQKLHDAFFKWQTKPKMTIHGDLYYEGKEFETRLKEKKPGDLSEDLRIALGMPTGPNANKCPPPWLIAMQRYGPPPSYPNLKIPGLNAPIPDGCSFGYHAGGWGKPPVDEMGRPLYGDVFGTQSAENMPHMPEEEIDHTLWGELESESSEEEEEDEEEDDDDDEQKEEDDTGLVTPAEGLITPSGFSSIPAGMETPDMIELRKRKIEAEMEGGETPALYTILPEKKSERVGASMMGSTHIYDLAGAIPTAKMKTPGTTSVPPQGIEVALDPSELEMDTAAMAARYEQTMREQQSQLEKEDLSDMVAEHAARQKTKRKRQQQDTGKAPKKYKEFKF